MLEKKTSVFRVAQRVLSSVSRNLPKNKTVLSLCWLIRILKRHLLCTDDKQALFLGCFLMSVYFFTCCSNGQNRVMQVLSLLWMTPRKVAIICDQQDAFLWKSHPPPHGTAREQTPPSNCTTYEHAYGHELITWQGMWPHGLCPEHPSFAFFIDLWKGRHFVFLFLEGTYFLCLKKTFGVCWPCPWSTLSQKCNALLHKVPLFLGVPFRRDRRAGSQTLIIKLNTMFEGEKMIKVRVFCWSCSAGEFIIGKWVLFFLRVCDILK